MKSSQSHHHLLRLFLHLTWSCYLYLCLLLRLERSASLPTRSFLRIIVHFSPTFLKTLPHFNYFVTLCALVLAFTEKQCLLLILHLLLPPSIIHYRRDVFIEGNSNNIKIIPCGWRTSHVSRIPIEIDLLQDLSKVVPYNPLTFLVFFKPEVVLTRSLLVARVTSLKDC